MHNIIWLRKSFKSLFCFNKPLVYFDNASTTQKPLFLLDVFKHINYGVCTEFVGYQPTSLTTILKKSNKCIKSIYSMNNDYTWMTFKSSMDAINAIYNSYWSNKQGTRILTCIDSEHSTFSPIFGKANAFNLDVIGLDPDLIPNIRQYLSNITNNISLIILNHMSDVVGLLIPIRLYAVFKRPNTALIIDGTQAASHFNINIESINCDVYLISSDNIYTFPNICLCFIKLKLLTNLDQLALNYKGVHKLSLNPFNCILNITPITYQSHSSNVLDIIGLTEVLKWKQRFNLNHEEHICKYL